jgi:hypothetical protein
MMIAACVGSKHAFRGLKLIGLRVLGACDILLLNGSSQSDSAGPCTAESGHLGTSECGVACIRCEEILRSFRPRIAATGTWACARMFVARPVIA